MTIALLIGGNLVSAQEEPAANATEVEATNESSQSDATDSTQPQTDPEAVLDYEPSESISEDLSVSFPVTSFPFFVFVSLLLWVGVNVQNIFFTLVVSELFI